MSNKFVNVEIINSIDGTTERCITEVDWEALRDSVVYQGVVIKKEGDEYIIEEPAVNSDTIFSKSVKTHLASGYKVGDVVEYNDVYESDSDVCTECMDDLFFDEKQEEYYCPICE